MKKRLLSFVLALCMVLVLLPGTVQAAGETQSGEYGELTWKYDNGTLTISGKGDLPDGGSAPWANYSDHISRVIVEDGITNLGNFTFFNYSALTSITIPRTVNTIPGFLFNGCSNLSEVIIQNGVKYIENHAFAGCSKLTHISIPASVIRMGTYGEAYAPFSECVNLTEITVDSKNKE